MITATARFPCSSDSAAIHPLRERGEQGEHGEHDEHSTEGEVGEEAPTVAQGPLRDGYGEEQTQT